MTPNDHDHALAQGGWFSLPLAVISIAARDGFVIDPQDMVAALGLPWWVTASDDEPDTSCWPLLARDALLDELSPLYGLATRPVHPPGASRGLSTAGEFAQHFEASHRPFIDRALENGQPVLAWRGWADPHEWCWGTIDSRGASGTGYHGTVWTCDGSFSRTEAHSTLLVAPALQLRVMERRAWRPPDPHSLVTTALCNARRAVSPDAGEPLGVKAGAGAIEAWIARLRSARAAPTHLAEAMLHGAAARGFALAASCGVRFLDRYREVVEEIHGEAVWQACRTRTDAMCAGLLEAGRAQNRVDAVNWTDGMIRSLAKVAAAMIGPW